MRFAGFLRSGEWRRGRGVSVEIWERERRRSGGGGRGGREIGGRDGIKEGVATKSRGQKAVGIRCWWGFAEIVDIVAAAITGKKRGIPISFFLSSLQLRSFHLKKHRIWGCLNCEQRK